MQNLRPKDNPVGRKLTGSDRKKERREKNVVNSGHYVPPAMPKGSERTLLGQKVGCIIQACSFLEFKHRKQLVEASLISHLRYGLQLYSQGTSQVIKRVEGLLSSGARIVLQKGRRQW